MRRIVCLLGLFLLGCGLSGSRLAPSCLRPISIDGLMEDWDGVDPAWEDSAGDALKPGVDLGRLWIANDEDAFYLRVELGRETILQNSPEEEAGHDLRIMVDLDGSSDTGLRAGQTGIDLEIRPGWKFVYWYRESGVEMVPLNDIEFLSGPTHSGLQFEIGLPWVLQIPDFSIPAPQLVRLFLSEGPMGDRLPDEGHISYARAAGKTPPEPELSLEKSAPTAVRLLSHNVSRNGPSREPAPFGRLLRSLAPDIIALQELWDWSPDEAGAFVEDVFADGREWFAEKNADCVTLSHWPIAASALLDGNLITCVDLPDDVHGGDLVLFNVHTPCCGNNEGRDFEHDRLAATWRSLLEGKGPFQIQPNDIMVMAGDFNMVGFERQLRTVRDGEIIDKARFGPDFRPSRLQGSLVNVPLRHTHSRMTYTWKNDRDRFTPGKLDYILLAPDHARVMKNFTLYTPEIPQSVLEASGLLAADSAVSDHLVLVADLEPLP